MEIIPPGTKLGCLASEKQVDLLRQLERELYSTSAGKDEDYENDKTASVNIWLSLPGIRTHPAISANDATTALSTR